MSSIDQSTRGGMSEEEESKEMLHEQRDGNPLLSLSLSRFFLFA
jgi:hypothetical protein